MPCTTLLVGRKASFDGSTLIARNDDSQSGTYNVKRLCVVPGGRRGGTYESVISHVRVALPDEPSLRYTATPNQDVTTVGIWGEHGINEANVAMTATETITTNARVQGADPYVVATPEAPGGIGEEDLVTLVLPYATSARDAVLRTGELLATYGTYEPNGIGFSDEREVWWLETVGGHHWIARRVPDDCYVVMPNQLGIDSFDLADAEGAGAEHLASPDLRAWMERNHLGLERGAGDVFNPRWAFGSASDADHVYNTPRAWDMHRVLSPHAPATSPEADDIAWARVPERLLTVEDVKYVLSRHYQGTEFDPYGRLGTDATRRLYRPIGISRNMVTCVLQVRGDAPRGRGAIHWVAFGSNPFNALAPFFANVDDMPAYLRDTTPTASTESLYWSSRLVAALADAHFDACASSLERYQQRVAARGWAVVHEADAAAWPDDEAEGRRLLEQANQRTADMLRHETDALLDEVLAICSNHMRNAFARSDG